jgi:hypothetical protein
MTLPHEPLLLRAPRRVVRLPEEDPVIDAMPSSLRREVALTWARRAHEELKVAMAFSILSREVLETGAAPDVLAVIARAVHDEVRHAEVCRALASRYADADVAWPTGVEVETKNQHPDARARVAFHLVMMCCVNEAIASVYLEKSLVDARSPCARAAVGELLADEVLHARVGWVFAARLDAPTRGAIERSLWTLMHPIVQCWWEEGAVTLPEGAAEHGIPSVETTRASTTAAVFDVVLPGFEAVGIDAGEARARMRELARG